MVKSIFLKIGNCRFYCQDFSAMVLRFKKTSKQKNPKKQKNSSGFYITDGFPDKFWDFLIVNKEESGQT